MRHFLQVPQRVHNAVLLMADLAEHSQSGDFVSLNDIAERNHISRGFLEEIAVPLKAAGLIDAKRGAYGGYKLASEPDEISVGDVVAAIEGPLELVECSGCAMSSGCSSKSVWSNVQRHVEDSLHSISLADVMSGE